MFSSFAKYKGADASGNKIALRTDQPYYIEGDLVTGNVYVDSPYGIQCNGVFLEIKGEDKAEMEVEYSRTKDDGEVERWTEEKKSDKTYIDVDLCISNFSGQLPAGQFVFPFQYQLPMGLPGSFREKHHSRYGQVEKYKAKVTYKLKAKLKGVMDLKTKQYIMIYPKEQEVKPAFDEKTGKVLTMCCIPRGDVNIKAWFDKDKYQPGDQAAITVEIDNQSSVAVDSITVKLMRVLSLNADGYTHRVVTTVSENNYPGIEPESKDVRQTPLDISSAIQPATTAKHIDCKYHVDVEAQVPWAPDIEIHLPTKIHAPQFQTWGTVWEGVDTANFQTFEG